MIAFPANMEAMTGEIRLWNYDGSAMKSKYAREELSESYRIASN